MGSVLILFVILFGSLYYIVTSGFKKVETGTQNIADRLRTLQVKDRYPRFFAERVNDGVEAEVNALLDRAERAKAGRSPEGEAEADNDALNECVGFVRSVVSSIDADESLKSAAPERLFEEGFMPRRTIARLMLADRGFVPREEAVLGTANFVTYMWTTKAVPQERRDADHARFLFKHELAVWMDARLQSFGCEPMVFASRGGEFTGENGRKFYHTPSWESRLLFTYPYVITPLKDLDISTIEMTNGCWYHWRTNLDALQNGVAGVQKSYDTVIPLF